MKHSSIVIKSVTTQSEKFRKKILGKLDAHSRSTIGSSHRKPVELEAKNEKGTLVGGLVGRTYWNWLYVEMLCVDPKYRGRGLGERLLREAEGLAKSRGCKYVHLDTFSFQSPGFYRKLGYRRFGQIGPYPKGHVRYYLKKKL